MARRKPSLPALVQDYLRELAAARSASPHTLRAYAADLGELVDFLERRGIEDPGAVNARTLRGFLMELDERGLARSSVQRKLSAARSFFKHLLKHARIAAHPATGLRAGRTRARLPSALEVGEVERLIDSPDLSTGAGRRDRALLECMYSAGTRARSRSERSRRCRRTCRIPSVRGRRRARPVRSS